MPYYKDHQNKVHVLEDASFAHLLPNGCVEITEAEAIELQKPPPETPEQVVARLKAELRAIEQKELEPRRTREINIRLMEYLATLEGITPEQLAQNPAYAGMKEVDAQCAALRQQIKDLKP